MGRFWDILPTALCEDRQGPGMILRDRGVNDVSTKPVPLPTGFSWSQVGDNVSIADIKKFLDQNYVSDSEGSFRLTYSEGFIRDFLDEGHPSWNAAILNDENVIVGFIAAAHRKVYIKGDLLHTVEVNLLCVKNDIRHKRFAEYLIQEITRKVELQGIFTAIFTSGQPLPPKAFTTARYLHKFLDVKRLNAVGYTDFDNDNLDRAVKIHQHHKGKKMTNPLEMYILRSFKETDVDYIAEMFSVARYDHVLQEVMDAEKLSRLASAPYFDNYVVEQVSVMMKKRSIVGFISVYNMDVLVLNADGGTTTLETSYIYTYCGNVLPCINDLFTALQNRGKAVVTCLDIGKNKAITRSYNMLPGTGYLNYYMYNYRLPLLPPEEVSYMVL